MRIPRRITNLTFATLVVLSSSVFLLPENVSAQAAPLIENKPIIELHKEKVAQKSSELQTTQQQIEEIEARRLVLAKDLEAAKSDIESLTQQIADKKAAAEAEKKRLEEIKNMFVRVNVYAGNSAGNNYAPGYCTWYVKSKRPDLPNNLGNADTWYANAAAQGFSVGTAPKKGAAAQQKAGMHVAFVEGVSLDGQSVTISEMNYGGLYRMNTRTVPASQFIYIYEKN